MLLPFLLLLSLAANRPIVAFPAICECCASEKNALAVFRFLARKKEKQLW